MARRQNLNEPPRVRMARIVDDLRTKQREQATVAHGAKHMGATGDLLWESSGLSVSLRQLDQNLSAAQDRIDAAANDLAASQERLKAAESAIGATRSDLNSLEAETMPSEAVAAKIASFMSTATKKLIVTDEAVLNHATLIGKTVVDQINVQGKLVGTDGVFTGTVDFANINVTGEAIINKLVGKTIDAVTIVGSTVRTSMSYPYAYMGRFTYEGTNETSSHGMFVGGENGSAIKINSGKATGGQAVISLHDTTDNKSMELRGSAGSGQTGHGLKIFHKNGMDAINLYKQGEDNSRAAIMLHRWDGVRGIELWSADGSNHADMRINDGSGISAHHLKGNGPMYLAQNRVMFYGTDRPADNDYRDTLELRSGEGRLIMHGIGSPQANRVKTTGRWEFLGGLQAVGAPTTSAVANTHMVSPGHRTDTERGRLYFSTSSRRYKRNIVDWNPRPEQVLSLRPRQWQHSDPNSPIDERWHVGFVAEEVHDLGLAGLVRYEVTRDGDYVPEGLNYERFPAAHQIVLTDHEERVRALEQRIASLEGTP